MKGIQPNMPKTYKDERGAIRTEFAVGEEPRVLAATSEQCQDGECEKCPGIFHLEEYGKEPIFCVHDCHKKSNQDV